MEVIIKDTPDSASVLAARVVARHMRQKPGCVPGLATGRTPRLLYADHYEWVGENKLPWQRHD